MFPNLDNEENELNGEKNNKSNFNQELPFLLLDAAKQWEIGFDSYEDVIKILLDNMLEMHQKNEHLEKQLRDTQNHIASKDFEMVQYKAALIKLESTERSEHKLKAKIHALERKLRNVDQKQKDGKNGDPIPSARRNIACQTDLLTTDEGSRTRPSVHGTPKSTRDKKGAAAVYETPPFDRDDDEDGADDMISVMSESDAPSDNGDDDCFVSPYDLHISYHNRNSTYSSAVQNILDVLYIPDLVTPIDLLAQEFEEGLSDNPCGVGQVVIKREPSTSSVVIKEEYLEEDFARQVSIIVGEVKVPSLKRSSFTLEWIENDSFTKNLNTSKLLRKKFKRKKRSRYMSFGKRARAALR